MKAWKYYPSLRQAIGMAYKEDPRKPLLPRRGLAGKLHDATYLGLTFLFGVIYVLW